MLYYILSRKRNHKAFLKKIRLPSITKFLQDDPFMASLVALGKHGFITNHFMAFISTTKDTEEIHEIKIPEDKMPVSRKRVMVTKKRLKKMLAQLPEKYSPATINASGYLDRKYPQDRAKNKKDPFLLLLGENTTGVVVSAEYHKMIVSRYPKAIPYVKESLDFVLYKENDKIVGVITPEDLYLYDRKPFHSSKHIIFED